MKSSPPATKQPQVNYFSDHGQVQLYGSDANYTDKSLNARVTDVHRILASGSEVCKRNMVILDNQGGNIVPSWVECSKENPKVCRPSVERRRWEIHQVAN